MDDNNFDLFVERYCACFGTNLLPSLLHDSREEDRYWKIVSHLTRSMSKRYKKKVSE